MGSTAPPGRPKMRSTPWRFRHSRTIRAPGIFTSRSSYTSSKLNTVVPTAADLALLDSRLRRRQPRTRDQIGRARDVGHLHAVTELDRRRLAAVLAADPDLQIGPATAPPLDADLDHL